MALVSVFRQKPDGSLVCENPVSEKERVRLRLVDDAIETTQKKYKAVLTAIVQNEPHDATELLRLAAALHRDERDIATDLEDRAADLQDEEDARRADEERQALVGKIERLQDDANGFATTANESFNECMRLQEKINAIHDAVGQREKDAYRQAVAENHAALADQKRTMAEIEDLKVKLESIQPTSGRKAALHGQRRSAACQAKHDQKKKDSDASMQRYVDAQRQEELPDDLLHAALNPPMPNGPPTQNLGGVRLGTKNGEPVEVRVGRLV